MQRSVAEQMKKAARIRSIYFGTAAIVVALGCIYLSFEFGRYQAGFSLFDQREQVTALNATIAERDAEIENLRRRQAILETSGDIDAETYAAVESELAVLQERIQGLEEELVFYQGIVSPGDRVAGLRIQNLEAVPDPAMLGAYSLRILLVQSIVHDDRVTGAVRVSIGGRIGDEEQTLDLGDIVAEGGSAEIAYGFRYFQSVDTQIRLPDGLMPHTVQVEIWPREPRGDTVTQVFDWAQIIGNR